jgi:hypothetical protein
MNDKSFERTLEEIKALFFCTLYLWAVVFVSPLLLVIMISMFFCLLQTMCFSLYTFCVPEGTLSF